MASFNTFLQHFSIVGRVVDTYTAEQKKNAYDMILSDIDPKSLFIMAMAFEDEFIPLMQDFVRTKVQTYMTESLQRERAAKERAAEAKAATELDDSASTHSDTSASSEPVDVIELFRTTHKGMRWSDIDDLEPQSEEDEKAPNPPPQSPQSSVSWAQRIEAFPPLGAQATSPVRSAPRARTQQPSRRQTAKPVDAQNWKADREKTVTSENWYFKLGLYDESHDWFLWESDSDNMPIGWRCDRAGWYTSRSGALFRHKLSNIGSEWIHQTYDKADRRWVSKDYETYKQMMKDARGKP